MNIVQVVNNQRNYFQSGATLDVEFRLSTLRKLKSAILENKDKIYDAFKNDLNKCEFDVDATELGMLCKEIDFMLSHLKRLAKPKRVKTSLLNFSSRGYIYPEPYGVVLVVAPWNYPLQLSLIPLVDAIASGNTVVLKPSNYTSSVAKVIKDILSIFNDKYISVVLGGREQNQELFDQKFDFIFFTGGTTVAKLLMEKASKNLTPSVFELGGKSPCIVNKYANIDLAAKRIVWGKYLNAGQTCVAPDYVLVNESIKDEFLAACKKYIEKFYYEKQLLVGDEIYPYSKKLERQKVKQLSLLKSVDTKSQIESDIIDGGSDSDNNGRDVEADNNCDVADIKNRVVLTDNFPFIVNEKHKERLKGLIDAEKVYVGNEWSGRRLSPTILQNVTWDDAVMGEEIFGPILPVLTFNNLYDMLRDLKSHDKPLACYIFGCDKGEEEMILREFSFGGGCVNDTIMHLTEERLPFGGVGLSGMGSYHGKKSFETFSHYKSVLKKSNLIDLNIRYMPYTKGKSKITKTIFGIK